MPLATSADITVNDANSADQSTPDIVALANGKIYVSWRSLDGTSPDYDVHGRLLDINGNPISADIKISDPSTEQQSFTSVAALKGGRTVVTWFSHEPGASKDGLPYYDVFAKIIGPNGAPVTAQFQVNTTDTPADWKPSVTTLANGNFVIAWEGGRVDADSNSIYARLYKPNGTPIGKDFKVNTTAGTIEKHVEVSALANGGYTITWEEISNNKFDIRARNFDAKGKPVGKDFLVLDSTAVQLEPAIAKLSNGSQVVAWQSSTAVSDSHIHARLLNSKGQPVGSEIIVSSDSSHFDTSPEVVTLNDDRFMVFWTSQSSFGLDIKARIFSASGAALSDEFTATSNSAGAQFDAHATLLKNGRVALTFVDNQGQRDIKTTIIDPYTYVGTANGETYTGSTVKDTIFGNDGSDNLIGRKGKDYIDGGADNDILRGGADNDKLIGNSGADDLFGGKGNDKFIYFSPTDGSDIVHKFTAGDQFVFDSNAFGLGSIKGNLSAKYFFAGPAAHDADDRFIYTKSTGQLWFDSDGTGESSQVLIATLDNHFKLTAADIKLDILLA